MTERAAATGLADIRSRTTSLQSSRTSRTRARIRDGVRALVEGGVPVTVKAIASAAGISRGTFYSHYARLDELAVDILAEDLLARPFSVEALIDLYVGRRDFYRHALHETNSRAVLEGAVEITFEALLARVADESERELDSLVRLARFTAWGYIGTLDQWLREDQPMSRAELTAFLRARTPAALS